MLYQLSYFRIVLKFCENVRSTFSGKRWIRTTEGKNQQIYSLPHLATLVSSQIWLAKKLEPMEGFEPPTSWLQISCSGQLSYIGVYSPIEVQSKRKFLKLQNFPTTFSHFFSKNSILALFLRPTTSRLNGMSPKIGAKIEYFYEK